MGFKVGDTVTFVRPRSDMAGSDLIGHVGIISRVNIDLKSVNIVGPNQMPDKISRYTSLFFDEIELVTLFETEQV